MIQWLRGAALPPGCSELTGTRCVLSTAVVPGRWWCGAAEGGVQSGWLSASYGGNFSESRSVTSDGVAQSVRIRAVVPVDARNGEYSSRIAGGIGSVALCSHAVCLVFGLARWVMVSREPGTRFALGGDRDDRGGVATALNWTWILQTAAGVESTRFIGSEASRASICNAVRNWQSPMPCPPQIARGIRNLQSSLTAHGAADAGGRVWSGLVPFRLEQQQTSARFAAAAAAESPRDASH